MPTFVKNQKNLIKKSKFELKQWVDLGLKLIFLLLNSIKYIGTGNGYLLSGGDSGVFNFFL